MADIRVERRTGLGWLWALLALLAIAGLVWWLMDEATERPEPAAPIVAAPPVQPEPVPAVVAQGATAAGPVTTLDAILAAPDPRALAGQPVRLAGIPVQAVPGDAIFMVGPSADRTVRVQLTEVPTPGTPVEGKVNVNPGQIVTIEGTLRSSPGGANSNDMAAGQDVYILARSVDVVEAR